MARFRARGDGGRVLACSDCVGMFADDPVLVRHYDIAQPGRYDALYLPRLSWHAAGLDVHDVALTDEAAWVVATRFSCVATLSDRHSFVPHWRPRFISDRSEEHTSELQSLMRISYAVFCLKKKKHKNEEKNIMNTNILNRNK